MRQDDQGAALEIPLGHGEKGGDVETVGRLVANRAGFGDPAPRNARADRADRLSVARREVEAVVGTGIVPALGVDDDLARILCTILEDIEAIRQGRGDQGDDLTEHRIVDRIGLDRPVGAKTHERVGRPVEERIVNAVRQIDRGFARIGIDLRIVREALCVPAAQQQRAPIAAQSLEDRHIGTGVRKRKEVLPAVIAKIVERPDLFLVVIG